MNASKFSGWGLEPVLNGPPETKGCGRVHEEIQSENGQKYPSAIKHG